MEEKLELGRSSFAIRAIYVFPLWFYSFLTVNKVVYVCSSVWLLAVVSREKEIKFTKWQLYSSKTMLSVILWISSALHNSYSILSLIKITWCNSQQQKNKETCRPLNTVKHIRLSNIHMQILHIKNGILIQKWYWPTEGKYIVVFKKNSCIFEVESREFKKN